VRPLAALVIAGTLAVLAPPATADPIDDAVDPVVELLPPPVAENKHVRTVVRAVRGIDVVIFDDQYCAYYTDLSNEVHYLACVPAPDGLDELEDLIEEGL
jgi:hypothetical protein